MRQENNLYIFTDGSVDNISKTGIGTYLITNDLYQPPENMQHRVKTCFFEDTSSTKLELQIMLEALKNIHDAGFQITLYTDSQNIEKLIARRAKLEKNDFKTTSGKLLNNQLLYREFFILWDEFKPDIIKLKGHKKSGDKNYIDRYFTLVDRTSRRALREIIKTC